MKKFWYPLVAAFVAVAVLAAPIVSWPEQWRPLPKTNTSIIGISGVSTDELASAPALPPAHDHEGLESAQVNPTGRRGAQFASPPGVEPGQVESHDSPTILTQRLVTDPYDLVAVSWQGDYDPATRVHVRVKENGIWSGWHLLEDGLAHAPDHDSLESINANRVTEPLMVADADGVQVRIDSPQHVAVDGAEIALVSAEQGLMDISPQARAFSAANAAVMPAVI